MSLIQWAVIFYLLSSQVDAFELYRSGKVIEMGENDTVSNLNETYIGRFKIYNETLTLYVEDKPWFVPFLSTFFDMVVVSLVTISSYFLGVNRSTSMFTLLFIASYDFVEGGALFLTLAYDNVYAYHGAAVVLFGFLVCGWCILAYFYQRVENRKYCLIVAGVLYLFASAAIMFDAWIIAYWPETAFDKDLGPSFSLALRDVIPFFVVVCLPKWRKFLFGERIVQHQHHHQQQQQHHHQQLQEYHQQEQQRLQQDQQQQHYHQQQQEYHQQQQEYHQQQQQYHHQQHIQQQQQQEQQAMGNIELNPMG